MHLLVRTNNGYIAKAIAQSSDETISKLNQFYEESDRLEKDYNKYAYDFVRQTLDINNSLDTRKRLQELLVDLGFKSYRVSKMIGVAKKSIQLTEQKSDATEWFNSLPASTAVILSTADDDAFNKVWVNDSKWGAEKVSKHKAEELVQKYSKKLPRDNFESNSPSNLEKARKLLVQYPELITLIDKYISEE